MNNDKFALDKEESIESNIYDTKKSFTKSIYEWIDSFVIALVAVILVFTFFLGKVRVDGTSMENTLLNDDQLIITGFNYTPKKGDIVIVSRNPENKVLEAGDSTHEPIVKRVIATSGDSVEIKDGKVYVNDIELDEPYIKDYKLGADTKKEFFEGKQIVPNGRIFVLGDNRSVSHDSRYLDILFIDNRYVLGHVLCRIFPFDSIETF